MRKKSWPNTLFIGDYKSKYISKMNVSANQVTIIAGIGEKTERDYRDADDKAKIPCGFSQIQTRTGWYPFGACLFNVIKLLQASFL